MKGLATTSTAFVLASALSFTAFAQSDSGEAGATGAHGASGGTGSTAANLGASAGHSAVASEGGTQSGTDTGWTTMGIRSTHPFLRHHRKRRSWRTPSALWRQPDCRLPHRSG